MHSITMVKPATTEEGSYGHDHRQGQKQRLTDMENWPQSEYLETDGRIPMMVTTMDLRSGPPSIS